MSAPRNHKPFYALLLLSLLAYGGLVCVDLWYGTLRGAAVGWTIGFYGVAFAAYVGILLLVEKRPLPLRWLWGAALLFRFLLLLTTPTLSDDVYRYMWDGYVATQGVSPYALPIDSPQLDYLDHPVRSQANNTWMASPYLPVAQWLFAALVFLFPLHPLSFQIAMVLADLATGILLAKLLKMGRFAPRRILIYLLNPLVIVEVAHGAHVDAWMNLWLVGAVWFGVRCQVAGSRSVMSKAEGGQVSGVVCRGWEAVLWAGATLTKGLPGLALLVLYGRWPWRRIFLFGFVMIALLLPAGLRAGWGVTGSQDGTGLFGALRIYAAQWQFNGAIYPWLVQTFGWIGIEEAVRWANVATAVALPLLFLTVWLLARNVAGWVGMIRLTAVLFIAYLLLSPTFHPWYALIVTALLPFFSPVVREGGAGWLVIAAWLYLNGSLILSYLAYSDPANFAELPWVRAVEWMPTAALLLLALLVYGRDKLGQHEPNADL